MHNEKAKKYTSMKTSDFFQKCPNEFEMFSGLTLDFT